MGIHRNFIVPVNQFLILDICGCEVIVIQDIFPGKYCQTEYSITMSDLKNRSDYEIQIKKQNFLDNFRKELDPYVKKNYIQLRFVKNLLRNLLKISIRFTPKLIQKNTAGQNDI